MNQHVKKYPILLVERKKVLDDEKLCPVATSKTRGSMGMEVDEQYDELLQLYPVLSLRGRQATHDEQVKRSDAADSNKIIGLEKENEKKEDDKEDQQKQMVRKHYSNEDKKGPLARTLLPLQFGHKQKPENNSIYSLF